MPASMSDGGSQLGAENRSDEVDGDSAGVPPLRKRKLLNHQPGAHPRPHHRRPRRRGPRVLAERKEQRTMTTQIQTGEREIVLVEDARIRPMMGLDILETLPSARIPYSLVDPFILVHEGVVPITPEWASLDTKHPHRGFDNLWYLIAGAASTGHSTGPDGAMERARLQTGSLLKLRTGRGV